VNSTQLESFVTLTATSALVIILVILGGPRLARLLFRQRVESIRDDCMDAILDGRLQRGPLVDRFLAAIEHGAERARWRTLPRIVALYIACVNLGVGRAGPAERPSYAELRPDERDMMHSLETRVEAAYQSYLVWGSPAGWAFGPLVLIAHHIRPRGKLATTDGTLPALAREAMCTDTDSRQTAEGWPSWTRRMYAGR
jgi:hypothetical protein